jgi:ribosome maturation protein SDO1
VKQQALEAMHALIAWQPIPVMRARMRLRITCPTNVAKQAPKSKIASEDVPEAEQGRSTIKDRILSFVEQIESQDVLGEEWEVIGFVEPGAFKALGEFCSAETKGRGRLEVLDMAVTHTDD